MKISPERTFGRRQSGEGDGRPSWLHAVPDLNQVTEKLSRLSPFKHPERDLIEIDLAQLRVDALCDPLAARLCALICTMQDDTQVAKRLERYGLRGQFVGGRTWLPPHFGQTFRAQLMRTDDVGVLAFYSDAEAPKTIELLEAFAASAAGVHSGIEQILSTGSHALSAVADSCRLHRPRLNRLYITGHGLAGAVAVLFARTLSVDVTLRPLLHGVYTFGQPKFLTHTGADGLRHDGFDRIVHRLVQHGDWVPALPTLPFYGHLGRLYIPTTTRWIDAADAPLALLGVEVTQSPVLATHAKRRFPSLHAAATLVEHLLRHEPRHYLYELELAARST